MVVDCSLRVGCAGWFGTFPHSKGYPPGGVALSDMFAGTCKNCSVQTVDSKRVIVKYFISLHLSRKQWFFCWTGGICQVRPESPLGHDDGLVWCFFNYTWCVKQRRVQEFPQNFVLLLPKAAI